MNIVKRSAKRVLMKLIEKVLIGRIVESTKPKPGQYIKQLSPEDRETLKELKSEDAR